MQYHSKYMLVSTRVSGCGVVAGGSEALECKTRCEGRPFPIAMLRFVRAYVYTTCESRCSPVILRSHLEQAVRPGREHLGALDIAAE